MLGTTSAILLAGGAFSAASSIIGGQQQAKAYQKQAEYNAQISEQQAEMISQKKKIQDYQFNRNIARARSSMVAATAGKGLLPSGSPLAVMIDTESQMLFDKAIQDYNLSVERNFALSSASYSRQTGYQNARLARYKGYSGAFTTALTTGAQIGISQGWGTKIGKL